MAIRGKKKVPKYDGTKAEGGYAGYFRLKVRNRYRLTPVERVLEQTLESGSSGSRDG